MSHSSLPRLSAVTALTIACLLTATPLAAQENSTIPSSPAQGSAQAQDVTPATTAPETPAAQAPTAQPTGEVVAPTGASDTAAAPAPAPQAQAQDTPSAAPTVPSAPDAATTETAPTEAASTEPAAVAAPPDPAAVTAPVPQPTQAPGGNLATPPEAPSAPEPAQQTMLPQVIADALGPLGPPSARDPNLPHDLSPMGMFWAADIVVKGVMLGLIFASIITWTILVAKLLELGGALKTVQSGIRRIERSPSLPAALAASGKRRDPVSRMIRASATEYDQSAPALDVAGDSGLKERVDSHLDRIEAVAGRRMGRGTGVLATIGSTAPFVGLFGTVWGIMNSFIGISESQTTNLAVVAPGIAEALLATAIGLVAAIPAVVIYNVFARAITGYRLRLANASAGVRRLVSRDLDFRGAPAHKGV